MHRLNSWRTRLTQCLWGAGLAVVSIATGVSATTSDLRVGIATHAFDHLGGIGDQATTAARSGANIIYVTGIGGLGYSGLPSQMELAAQKQAATAYLKEAKAHGIRLAIGYVCATSIVKLDQFDRHWSENLRARFHTAPAEWRQQDRQGKALRSWYGGDYEPACMNHPDWRAYERFILSQQIEIGCDGIFFDNPTVHPEGCYCRWCMEKFADFLKTGSTMRSIEPTDGVNGLEALRSFASAHRDLFLQFRCTIARDFLAEMREHARRLKPGALVTANNSLNSAEVLYSQCRSYAYNIYEMSKVEDFVVVEDMSSQPRLLTNGQAIEYGPMYEQLLAICHGKPVVAVTLADADYHTPANLMRLAMAEAAANRASYLSWPTWPEEQRERMISLVRPEVDFLRKNAGLIGKGAPRQDVTVFLPFRRWLETGDCAASRLTAQLSRANVPFAVICEDDLTAFMRQKPRARMPTPGKRKPVLLLESPTAVLPQERRLIDVFKSAGGTLVTSDEGDWMRQLYEIYGGPSLRISGPPTLRARVFDEPHRTVVHLLNLNAQRLSSFADKVIPARDVQITLQLPFSRIHAVRALTADREASSGPLKFSPGQKSTAWMEVRVPRVELSTLIVIE